MVLNVGRPKMKLMVAIRAVKRVGMTVMRCCGEHRLGRVVTTEAHCCHLAQVWQAEGTLGTEAQGRLLS